MKNCITRNFTIDLNREECKDLLIIYSQFYSNKLFLSEDKFSPEALDNQSQKLSAFFSGLFTLNYFNVTDAVTDKDNLIEFLYFMNILQTESRFTNHRIRTTSTLSKFLSWSDKIIHGQNRVLNKNVTDFFLERKNLIRRMYFLFAILSKGILRTNYENHEICESNVNYEKNSSFYRFMCVKYSFCQQQISLASPPLINSTDPGHESDGLLENRQSVLVHYLLNKYDFIANKKLFNISAINRECYPEIKYPQSNQTFLHFLILHNTPRFKRSMIDINKIRNFVNPQNLSELPKSTFLLFFYFALDTSEFLVDDYQQFVSSLASYMCSQFKIINFQQLEKKQIELNEMSLLILLVDKLKVLFAENIPFLRHFDKLSYNLLGLRRKFKNNMLFFFAQLTNELNLIRQNKHTHMSYFLKTLRLCIEGNVDFLRSKLSFSNDFSKFNMENVMISSMLRLYKSLYLNDKKN